MGNSRKILIGMLVVILGFLVTGNIGFFLVSLMCSGGVALVFYLPVAYVIGLVLDEVFFKRFISSGKTTQSAKIVSINETVKLTNDQIALANYIKEARANGMGDGQISGVLKDNGWLDEDIKSSFDLVSKYN